ncbi:hypothetical protein GW17_00006252 [Ensete ventricosum]|nr:hypothetical protein GW17_00006252 [Ensete ventricosum]
MLCHERSGFNRAPCGGGGRRGSHRFPSACAGFLSQVRYGEDRVNKSPCRWLRLATEVSPTRHPTVHEIDVIPATPGGGVLILLRRPRRVEAPPLLLRLLSAEAALMARARFAVRVIKSHAGRRIERMNAGDRQPTGDRKPITLSSKWSCEHLAGEGGPEKWCAAPLSIRLLHQSGSRLIAITDINYFLLRKSVSFRTTLHWPELNAKLVQFVLRAVDIPT